MVTIRKHPRADSWQVRYRDPANKQRSKNFATKTAAKRFAAAVETDKRRGEYIDPQTAKTTFGEYAAGWMAGRRELALSTQDRDRSYLRVQLLPTFGSSPVGRITPAEVREWEASQETAPRTRAKALWILRSVLELARTDGAFARNPAEGVKVTTPPVKVGRALSDDQLREVLAAAEDADSRSAALVWVLAMAGLRVGEVFALKRGDVDLAAGTLRVAGSMSRREGLRGPKTKAGERTIPIPIGLADRLRRHRDEQPVANLEGFLFTAARGGAVRYDNWRSRTWTRIVAQLDFEVTPHDLRHSCATRLFREEGWTPAHVQAFLGHADARMTLNTYTHIKPEELPRPEAVTL